MGLRFLLAAVLILPAAAQDPEPGQRNTVHLNKYAESDQLSVRAPALAAAGRWLEALAIFDEALEGHDGKVVFVDEDRAWGVREYVLDQIGRWPEEGKAVHRRKVDPLAEQLFETAKQARDAAALERLVATHPYSSHVDDALSLVAALRLDAGDAEGAAVALRRLLALDGEPLVVARLGQALSCAGRRAELAELLERARATSPEARVAVAGRDTGLVAHLEGLLRATSEARSAGPPLAVPGWEMVGGAPAGTRLAEPGVALGPAAWSLTIAPSRYDAEDDMGMRRVAGLTPTPEFRPLFPVVSDGILYVRNESILYALSFAARQPELLWQHSLPPPPGEVMFDNRIVYTLSVHDGRVFAPLLTAIDSAEDKLGYVRVKFPFPRRALFAFDAATGAPLWRLGGKLRAAAPEEGFTFAAAPVPDGERLYVGAVLQETAVDTFKHRVLCLEAATGRVLWSTPVGSGGTEINLFGNSTRESLGSPVAVTADSVYYVTNHGAAAALEKETGRLRWVHRYPQQDVRPTRSVYVMKNPLQWINSPPLAAQGVVVVTPTDSALLLALDARTGELRWQVPRSRDIRTVYGARDSTLVVGGERLEFYDLRTGKMAAAPIGEELAGTGRGVVAEDGIYVPCRDKLRQVRWDGAWDESRARPWPGGPADGGNLIVVDGAVVLASQDTVRVFFDRRDQEAAIRAELERNPDDLSLVYRGGLRYLQSGRPSEAARLFARVVERAAPEERLARAARKRLFSVEMGLAKAELVAQQPAAALERLGRALAAAPDPASRVEAALATGAVHEARGDPAAAVAEYQKLILAHGGEWAGGVRVFERARDAIAAVLAASGREPYAPWEEAAAKSLEAARRAGGAEGLAQVFLAYPNSAAAESALLEAAAAHGAAGRSAEETGLLRQFLREYPASARSADAQASLVRSLEKSGYHASARVFLRRMARLPETVRVADDGGARVAAREFAERRLKSPAYAAAAASAPVARLAPPLKPHFAWTEREFREGVPVRVLGAPPAEAAGLVLINYGGAVKALSSAGEVWRAPMSSGLRFAAWLEDGLVLAEERGVSRIDPRNGAALWRFASTTPLRGFALSGPVLYTLTTDPSNENASAVGALDAQRGVPLWSQPFEGIASSRIFASGETIVFTTVAPERIHVFEADTGRRLPTGPAFTAGLASQVVHVSDDLLAVHAERRFLEGYDLPGGALRWRVSLERFPTQAVEASAAGLVLVGARGPAEAFVAVVDPRTGKLSRLKEDLKVGQPRFAIAEGETLTVVARDPDSSVRVSALRLADLTVAWSTNAGERNVTLLPPIASEGHIVVAGFEGAGQPPKYAHVALLLDKAGRVVQNIRSGFVFERPPTCGVSNDQLVFSVDTKVEVQR